MTERNKEAKKISAKILIESVASYFFSLIELFGHSLQIHFKSLVLFISEKKRYTEDLERERDK